VRLQCDIQHKKNIDTASDDEVSVPVRSSTCRLQDVVKILCILSTSAIFSWKPQWVEIGSARSDGGDRSGGAMACECTWWNGSSRSVGGGCPMSAGEELAAKAKAAAAAVAERL